MRARVHQIPLYIVKKKEQRKGKSAAVSTEQRNRDLKGFVFLTSV